MQNKSLRNTALEWPLHLLFHKVAPLNARSERVPQSAGENCEIQPDRNLVALTLLNTAAPFSDAEQCAVDFAKANINTLTNDPLRQSFAS